VVLAVLAVREDPGSVCRRRGRLRRRPRDSDGDADERDQREKREQTPPRRRLQSREPSLHVLLLLSFEVLATVTARFPTNRAHVVPQPARARDPRMPPRPLVAAAPARGLRQLGRPR